MGKEAIAAARLQDAHVSDIVVGEQFLDRRRPAPDEFIRGFCAVERLSRELVYVDRVEVIISFENEIHVPC